MQSCGQILVRYVGSMLARRGGPQKSLRGRESDLTHPSAPAHFAVRRLERKAISAFKSASGKDWYRCFRFKTAGDSTSAATPVPVIQSLNSGADQFAPTPSK